MANVNRICPCSSLGTETCKYFFFIYTLKWVICTYSKGNNQVSHQRMEICDALSHHITVIIEIEISVI